MKDLLEKLTAAGRHLAEAELLLEQVDGCQLADHAMLAESLKKKKYELSILLAQKQMVMLRILTTLATMTGRTEVFKLNETHTAHLEEIRLYLAKDRPYYDSPEVVQHLLGQDLTNVLCERLIQFVENHLNDVTAALLAQSARSATQAKQLQHLMSQLQPMTAS